MTAALDVRVPSPRLSPDPTPARRPSARTATRSAPSTEQVLAAVVAFLSLDGRAHRWLHQPRPCPCTRTGSECEQCAIVTTLAQQALARGGGLWATQRKGATAHLVMADLASGCRRVSAGPAWISAEADVPRCGRCEATLIGGPA